MDRNKKGVEKEGRERVRGSDREKERGREGERVRERTLRAWKLIPKPPPPAADASNGLRRVQS